MEIVSHYNGYSIHYSSMTGTTSVYDSLGTLVSFPRLGESAGKVKAQEWIDTAVADEQRIISVIKAVHLELAQCNSMDGAGI